MEPIIEPVEKGDVVRIIHEGEPDEYGVVVYVYADGGFSAISETGFWALCERTHYEKTGKSIDISAIYKALKEASGE